MWKPCKYWFFFQEMSVSVIIVFGTLFSDGQIVATVIFRCDMLLLISPLGLELLLVS